MGKDTIRYILLYLGIAALVTVISYIGVSLYLKLPVVPPQVAQLLPQSIRAIVAPTPIPRVPVSGVGLTSVSRLLLRDGSNYYHVRGKFVGPLRVVGRNIVGEFVIDEDPAGAQIPFTWKPTKDMFTLGTVRGSFDERENLQRLSSEEIVQSVHPTEPVQLSIDYPPNNKHDPDMRYGLDQIISGFWSHDESFYLAPNVVTIFRP